MANRADSWEQWKVQATKGKHTEVELVGIPGRLRVRKGWARSISAITEHVAHHLRFRDGESHCVTVEGKETEWPQGENVHQAVKLYH